MIRKLLYLLLVIGACFSSNAQLSDLHYLPPLKQGRNNQAIRQQAIYLSTPEPTTFTVNAYRGTNPTPVATFSISNVNPAVYTLGNGDNNITLVNNSNTGIVLNNSGLRFESPSGNRFYVNYRGYSSAQAASLTSKGRVAMGTRFKWGGVPNLGAHSSKSNTLGIMATEDNTVVNVFGYDPACEFRLQNNVGGITADTYQITLNANESFVFEAYLAQSPAHRDGWIGASIVSDKDIVISNGSLNFGRQQNSGNRDAGIDQPVPENRLGKDYVFVRGNGGTNGATEFPLIIATADNTQIFINGSATPVATINNGEYFEVPSSFYSSNTVGANMFVQTSKDVYAYQCMAGASQVYTQGLNFVAPVNCLLPDVMDNIPDIRNMAGTLVNGGVTIIAAVNTPDANIVVNDGSGVVPLPASVPVAGSTDWKTFFIPNLNGDVSVRSTGPIAVGFFGFNGARGVAGYFSGFDTVPEVNLEIRGGGGCFAGASIFEATGNFDAYQWFGDGVLIPGANGPSYTPTTAGDYFVRGTKGPCTYDSQPISAYYCDPDVVINKTVDKAEIMEGETATFRIHVRNLGIGPVTNLQITDNIPTGLSLVSSFTISGTWNGNLWNIGRLNAGETAVLELEVRGDEIDTLPLLSLTNTVTNTQDQIDNNITEDNLSAHITVHNDYDNDGVNDSTDLDDDNDGIYDEEECNGSSFNISGGMAHISPLSSTPNHLILDIFSLDNSLNLQINGTDIAGEIQFQNTIGNQARFLDGTTYGENGIAQIYTLSGSPGRPLLRIVIDALGNFELLGSRTSNGPLEPMVLTTPAISYDWSSSGNHTLTVGQALTGPTNMSGLLYTAACDLDTDGIPNHLDLDSDGDGCSDANEFYKDANADGGDGGVYGTGVPMVDPTDGTVTTASYTAVVAPEILLGNTSEDLGGNDINGQGVSLGQSFEYVLRFQNTGDDNAINYSIRDVLPHNVTLDNVDTSDAIGTTYTYDTATRTLNFSIPDALVEVGDPEYSIRIAVTIASSCSDFVAACSSQLENLAFSTYQGTTNPNVFTDENGSNSITACPRTPEVARNSILNDLTNCNESRTVQLCGDDVVLAAGAGFVTYNWVLDTNGNGQVDAADTPLNDGDPDGDPSTLLVTVVGEYIVEKSANGSCPDLVERITVERFGATQTNPIVDYFNQVNSDVNPDNDLQGEIATCPIDGDILPKIFLCGANDEATIQLGITDAQSIVWTKLDEASCSDTGDDCANKNRNCTWNTVANGDNITLREEGEYSVTINYQNGCFSRFYFNVFKNNLDIDVISSDILCSTPGNIRITNIGADYGFQLIDISDNSVVVPFSANNGPNFDINTNGTYKVQVTQLSPVDGTPIVGSCIFETADIGILERDFRVNLSSTPADCNDLGTISVQALNALPNYSYELRLDDGSNGGQGSLVSSQPALNDNTYIFSNVNPENYIVITRTQDGCFDQQQITVSRIPDLSLGAVTAANITCTAGIVNLTPSGGQPNPVYEMAIWSKDGVPLYPDQPSVPNTAYQSTPSFLFGYRGTPPTYFPNEEGDYVFIVRDGSGCYALSNTVRVEDLDGLSISASHTPIGCADSATASMTVAVTGGTAPYQYSLDGGLSYQAAATFVNLAAGQYTITVMDSSGSGSTACVENFDYQIDQPFRLTASSAIVEDASCNPSGALVKIINANGGQAPYQYSFDGGSSFTAINEQRLSPGDYQLVIQDDLGCTFPMDLSVPNEVPDPSFTTNVTYDCDGLGTITAIPSNTADFGYSYALNGSTNTPSDNAIFTNVTNGTHNLTIGYSPINTLSRTNLFYEGFGAGPTTSIAEIGPGYCYEPQDGTMTNCNLGPAGILVNGEYTVTNVVTNPIPLWRNPNDHTGLTDGRFLAIAVSTLAGDMNVLWARRGIEVLPNREINLSLWAYNLLRTTATGNNPEILIELVDGTGTVIQRIATAEIPKNSNADDWHNRQVVLNPGANTSVDIVLRTNLNSDFGNHLILDDIEAYQLPESCEKTVDIAVEVEDAQEFRATVLGTIAPSCPGNTDGAIRFEVANFDAATGFEYSLDGGVNWISSLVSPVTTTANLGDGAYTIDVRRVNDTTCSTSLTATLSEPAPIVPSLSQTAAFSCFTTGGTLEASATGGSPSYEYQLEDSSNTIVVAYQSNSTFTNIADGDYVVRVRDQNGCEEVSTTAVTINPPVAIAFDVSATTCYDGQNNASITVTVNAGNGNYNFSLNGGAWVAPTPASSNTYTFSGLSDGSYDVEVTDAFGCTSNITIVDILPRLTAQVDVLNVSACADGSIDVNASGGDGNFVYAFVNNGTTVQDSDFGSASSLSITNATIGDYDVYVRDHSGTSPYCQFMETVTVSSNPTLAFTATPTAAVCFGDQGSIDVNISSGLAPYTFELIDLDHSVSNQIQFFVLSPTKTYFNLTPGNYNVRITDSSGCSQTISNIEVTQPDELTATVTGVTPATCTGDVNDFGFEFSGYPTTLGTIEFSADGGATWIGDNSVPGTTDRLTGYLSGDTVQPSMRTVDGAGNTVCQTDLPPFIIPFPLDDLDITISAVVVNCDELRVRVQGSEGVAPYEYALSDDPANFDIATATWILGGATDILGNTVPAGHGMYEWVGLVPGKTYVFYVRDDNGCVRQSNVNVNDITTNPMEIIATVRPSCNGANNGEITYTITDTDGVTEPNMNWTLFDINDNVVTSSGGNIAYTNTVTISNLAAGEYYIVVTQVDAGGLTQCSSGSENDLLEELDPITANLNKIQDISCEAGGMIAINAIQGGGGMYTYTVTGPAPFTTITGTTDNPVEIPANSPAGNYTVEISDQYGCSYPLGSIALDLSPNPVISSVVVDNCTSAPSVTINATSSAPHILYSLDGGTTYEDNAGVFTNVSPGNYTVFIRDGNGCTASSSIEVHPSLQATAVVAENLGCGAGQEAELLLEVTSGSGSYDYEIQDTSGTVVARQALVPPLRVPITAAETYTVSIYDNNTASPECFRTFSLEIPPAIVPDFTAIPTAISCFGNTDGTIVVAQVNNGNNPLTYSLIPNNGSFNATTNAFENLPGGTYEVIATGPNGCTTSISTIVVDEPNDISFDLPTVTPFGCSSGNTTNNASISINTASILGGSGNFVRFEFEDDGSGTILQNGSDATYISTDFNGGDILVRVYDDTGCSAQTRVNIPAYDQLINASISIDDAISCGNLGEDITIDVTGSISNYTSNPTNYEFALLSSGVFQASNQFADLAVGNYTFVIRNVNTACEITIDHVVEEPNTFDVTVEKLSDAVCFGDDGTIRLLMADATYSGSFSWNIYNTNGTPADRSDDGAPILMGTSPDFGPTMAIAVPAGNYVVEVTQDSFPACTQLRTFSISTPTAAISLAPVTTIGVGCTNDQGSATLQPQGGMAPYDIQWTNTNTGTSGTISQVNMHIFQNLVAGQYDIEVTDALGCVRNFANAFELLLPDAISGNITATALNCEGDTDASVSITLDPRNVSADYRYILNTYSDALGSVVLQQTASQPTPTFTNLGAGFYSISVLDDMDCTFESNILEIIDPVAPGGFLLTSTLLSCQVAAELELTATGGTAPYMWSVDGVTFNAMNEINGANTHLFQNLAAGTYQYYIRDSFNCISTLSNEITIDPIENLTLTLDTSAAVINCHGESSALIEATAAGGLGNYQYGLFADQSLSTEIRPYQNQGIFADLPHGTYYVSVQSEDCQTTSVEILIAEPAPLVIDPLVTNISCHGGEDGSIVLNSQGGSGSYQYAISPNLNQFDDDSVFDGLSAGDYTVIAQDSNGCFEVFDFTITEPSLLEMDLVSTPEICAGDQDGTIDVMITGGTPPYSTSLNSNNDADFVTGRVRFNALASGSYVVFVRDAMGCVTNQLIDIEAGANLSARVEMVYECSGDVPNNRMVLSLEDDSTSADLLYGLDTVDTSNMVLVPDFQNLSPGQHFVTIAHANGCINTINFEVEDFAPLTLTLEQRDFNEITAIASGGKTGYTYYFNAVDNGTDNTYYIRETGTYTVRVVDDNGCESTAQIFMEFIDIEIPKFFTPDGDGVNDSWIPRNIEAYPNIFINIFDRYGRRVYKIEDNAEGWNGLYNDANLPTGDYWYLIKLNGAEDRREFIGSFTLYR
ncbi:T9SS type B sorting domain-containing protein [Spongiimicrobium salis]|uniref:T9SS type B sorting domain-containing protein n=1 Tax=Spongiimicrobium salis TaxID=1667022 RepID=UPI00374CC1BF